MQTLQVKGYTLRQMGDEGWIARIKGTNFRFLPAGEDCYEVWTMNALTGGTYVGSGPTPEQAVGVAEAWATSAT